MEGLFIKDAKAVTESDYWKLEKYSGGKQHLYHWKTPTPSNVAQNRNPGTVLQNTPNRSELIKFWMRYLRLKQNCIILKFPVNLFDKEWKQYFL